MQVLLLGLHSHKWAQGALIQLHKCPICLVLSFPGRGILCNFNNIIQLAQLGRRFTWLQINNLATLLPLLLVSQVLNQQDSRFMILSRPLLCLPQSLRGNLAKANIQSRRIWWVQLEWNNLGVSTTLVG